MKLAQLIAETGEQEAVIQVLCHLLAAERTNIFLMSDISDSVTKQALKLLDKYKKGTPLAYILGYAYFSGRKFIVNKDVLIPRWDTEELLEVCEKKVIADVVTAQENDCYRILDLCCGSGILGISLHYLAEWLQSKHPEVNFEITLADVSHEALIVAYSNAVLHNADVKLVQSDLFANIHGRFDLIVCNPPYIPTNDIGKEDPYILKEPRLALDGGLDGLYFYRRILASARRYLPTGGTIIMEIGFDQADQVTDIAETCGYTKMKVYRDLGGHDRVVMVRK